MAGTAEAIKAAEAVEAAGAAEAAMKLRLD